jgi:hypothetical protein
MKPYPADLYGQFRGMCGKAMRGICWYLASSLHLPSLASILLFLAGRALYEDDNNVVHGLFILSLDVLRCS